MKSIRGLIWDVDGTLSDTIDLCVTSLQAAIEEHGGRAYSSAEIVGMFGPTEDGILRKVLGDRWEAAMDTYLAAYRRGHETRDLGFPGVIETVRHAAGSGVTMAVVTGKGARSAAITLGSLGIEDLFEPVVSGSMEGSIKSKAIMSVLDAWGLAPGTVAYIGDAPRDITESRDAGVIPVSAAWKADADIDELAALGPDVVLRTASELSVWLDAHLEV
jgi:phosphoglycolate phosphatase-like HAD superfamily hydrolase